MKKTVAAGLLLFSTLVVAQVGGPVSGPTSRSTTATNVSTSAVPGQTNVDGALVSLNGYATAVATGSSPYLTITGSVIGGVNTNTWALGNVPVLDSLNTFTGGMTLTGASQTNVNDNHNTLINTGTSTGTVQIGGSGAQTISIGSTGAGAKTITLGNSVAGSSLTFGAGQIEPVRVVTAAGAVTVATTDYIVVVNKASGAATTVNLPASPATGLTFMIKDGKGDAATNNITITPAAGNIDGAVTKVLSTNFQSVQVTYNGTQWNVL